MESLNIYTISMYYTWSNSGFTHTNPRRPKFELNDGICTADFTAGENHVGYENTVHGGIIFSALDDVMANVLYLQNIKAHTARCEIRYRKALQVGQAVRLRGWIENERKRLIVLKGEVRLAADDSVVADCEANFMNV